MVETVDIGNAEILHRLLLDELYPLLPLSNGRSSGARGIQDGAYLPFRDEGVEHGLVELPHSFGLSLIDIHGIAAEALENLCIGQLEYGLDFRLWRAVLLHHGTYFLTIDLGIFYGGLSHHVEVQFEHLSDFLVEGHLR